MNNESILSVEHLSVSFKVRHRELKSDTRYFTGIERKKTLAIVGESGSGKSVLTKRLLVCWNKMDS